MYKKENTIEYMLDFSEEEFLDELGFSKWEYLNRFKDYLIEKDSKYYFMKKVSNIYLYNEIIGRYLCNKINLNTTDLLVERKGIFRNAILTPNYRDKDYAYYRPRDNFEYGMRTRNFNDSYFKDLDTPLKDDVLKLLAVDLMMEQTDRYSRNMEVSILGDERRLAPVIDFELSFNNNSKFTYFNPFILINKNIKSLDKFYECYPEGYKYLDTIFKVTAGELIDYINDEYKLKVKRLVKKDIYCTVKRNQNIIRQLDG